MEPWDKIRHLKVTSAWRDCGRRVPRLLKENARIDPRAAAQARVVRLVRQLYDPKAGFTWKSYPEVKQRVEKVAAKLAAEPRLKRNFEPDQQQAENKDVGAPMDSSEELMMKSCAASPQKSYPEVMQRVEKVAAKLAAEPLLTGKFEVDQQQAKKKDADAPMDSWEDLAKICAASPRMSYREVKQRVAKVAAKLARAEPQGKVRDEPAAGQEKDVGAPMDSCEGLTKSGAGSTRNSYQEVVKQRVEKVAAKLTAEPYLTGKFGLLQQLGPMEQKNFNPGLAEKVHAISDKPAIEEQHKQQQQEPEESYAVQCAVRAFERAGRGGRAEDGGADTPQA